MTCRHIFRVKEGVKEKRCFMCGLVVIEGINNMEKEKKRMPKPSYGRSCHKCLKPEPECDCGKSLKEL